VLIEQWGAFLLLIGCYGWIPERRLSGEQPAKSDIALSVGYQSCSAVTATPALGTRNGE